MNKAPNPRTKRPGPSSPFSLEQYKYIITLMPRWDAFVDSDPGNIEAQREWCENLADDVFEHPLFKGKLDTNRMSPGNWKEVRMWYYSPSTCLIHVLGIHTNIREPKTI